MCKNKDGCSYKNCWFRHETFSEQNEEQHEVTEKILNMMEKITHRIVNLENLLNKQSSIMCLKRQMLKQNERNIAKLCKKQKRNHKDKQ